MPDRWQQVYRAGEVVLDPFTPAELDAVTLDAEALPAAERGPFLQAVTPLMTGQGTPADPAAEGWGPAVARTGPEMEGSAAAARAEAVASLERRGFVRPGPPEPPPASPSPAARPATGELAGWAAVPGGDAGARRQVTLLGDLAVITRIRAQPVWVAEAAVSPEPGRPDSAATEWRLIGRMYAPYRPPAGLVELPAGAGGSVPPYVLVRDDRAVQVLAGWCGADLAAYAKQRAGGAAPPGGAAPAAIMPTAELAGEFATLVLLRVALAEGQRVLVRTLVVATTGEGRHWLLDGEWWERSLPASVDDLGQRIAAMLKLPGGAGG
jgi:hypothetical protein